MAIGNLTGVNTTSDIPSNVRETGSSTLGQDTFLRLLTTQLQNQDPTNPVSNEQFVAQLAQFSQLEQLQGLSGKLDNIAVLNASMNNAAMANLLGQTVVAKGDTVHYDGEGPQALHYDASGATTSATLTVTDANGHVVYSADLGALPEGEGSYTWDGRGLDGSQLPEGDYTFSIGATSATGDSVDVQTLVRGVVDEMDFSTGAASPSVDGVRIEMADILRLDAARAGGA